MRALDAVLDHQAGPLDILCGYAVVLLSRPGARTSELLDLLGMLDPEHLLAIYFGLPEDCRRAVTRDFVWTYYVSRAPAAEIERALHELEVLDPEPISEPSRALAQWAFSDPAQAPDSPLEATDRAQAGLAPSSAPPVSAAGARVTGDRAPGRGSVSRPPRRRASLAPASLPEPLRRSFGRSHETRRYDRPGAVAGAKRGGGALTAPALSLSVVVGSNGAPGAVERCLCALEPQLDGADVLVCEPEPSPDELRRRFPFARFMEVPEALVPELWRAGIDASEGEIVALTISPMEPAPDWVATIRRQHHAVDVVGGAIDPAERLRVVDWAELFCRFARDLRPFPGHECVELPGDNSAYKRHVLERSRDLYRDGFWERRVNEQLRQAGVTLWHEPALVVRFGRSAGFAAFLSQRFVHARIFGRERGAEFSVARNVAGVLLAGAVPWVLVLRTAREVFRRARYRARFLAALPALAAYEVAWAVGEALGHADVLRGR